MYEIDTHDTVVDLAGVPPLNVGAPLPTILADDLHVIVAYRVAEPDPNWDGTYATMVGTGTEDQLVAIVRFRLPRAHLFGPPNDEAFDGHPLCARGLKPYSAAEVKSSSWIRRLERMNAVHPSHKPEYFSKDRHFIFAFHDSTFECIAKGFEVASMRGSMRDAVVHMAELLSE
jgi:hypothetical protein